MNLIREPRSGELANTSNPIRAHYDELNKSLGVGENPLFVNAPDDAIFCNTVGDEKPLFYTSGSEGKKWLTSNDLEGIKEAHPENILNDEQQFDLFSFMVGSMSPTIRDLGMQSWSQLVEKVDSPKVGNLTKLLGFIDSHKTNLTASLGGILKISVNRTQSIQVANGANDGTVLLMGETAWNRDKMVVWHTIRNARSQVQASSPFRQDGGGNIGAVYDMQIGFQDGEMPKVLRLNKFVYLLARQGLGEMTNETTSADQTYLTPADYMKHIYSNDPIQRAEQQQVEIDNFIIRNRLDGYQGLVQTQIGNIQNKLLEMDKAGGFDDVLKSIDTYK